MNTDAPRLLSRPAPHLAALAGLLAAGALLASGCQQPKKKAKKLFTQTLEDCRTTDSTFYEAELMTGDETTDVLTETCQEEMSEITLDDGNHSAEMTVGPYTWQAGVNEATGIWVLKNITWEPLSLARTRLDAEDPSDNDLSRAIDLLGDAQNEYGKSGWVRVKRLEAMLDLRASTRSDDSESKGYKLGDQAGDYYEETLAWAESNSSPKTAARARLAVTDYIRDYIDQTRRAKQSLGSQDEHLEKTIEQAEDDGDDEEAEKYRKELESLKEERPDKRERYDELMQQARKELCGYLDELSADGIDGEELTDRIDAANEGIDCQELLED